MSPPPRTQAPQRVLLELRPAFEGHAGIPQETRLLFRGLAGLPGVALEGLLQTGGRLAAPGLPADPARASGWSEDRRVDALSRVVVSLQPEVRQGLAARLAHAAALQAHTARTAIATLAGRRVPLGRFDATRYGDFIWRALFARTLPAADLPLVTTAGYRVARLPWSAAHALAGLTSRLGAALYPRLDTRAHDVFIAETPYPGRVSPPTRLVVRYHDAFPLLMPHTIVKRGAHRRAHYQALRRNVHDGAWFACVSEASRRDLLSIFPQAEPRAVTIPNMVSHRYRPEPATPAQVAEVLQLRASPLLRRRAADRGRTGAAPVHPAAASVAALPTAASAANPAPATPPPASGAATATTQPPTAGTGFLLMVSTLEPRKNHLGLIAAWELLRAQGHPALQLVLVGAAGWDWQPIADRLLPWAERGQAHWLDEVPAPELRRLYGQARVTVCPSFGEGFGFSGVEAMRCGGVVAAADLPVHREVYADAAEYFNPYSASHMAQTLARLLAPEAQAHREALRTRGTEVARRYLPEAVLPQWQHLLHRLQTAPQPSPSP
jgi:glycosyltransferase involved in cell wall biosynthesis